MDQKKVIPSEDLVDVGALISQIGIAFITYDEPVKTAFFGTGKFIIQLGDPYVRVAVYKKCPALIE